MDQIVIARAWFDSEGVFQSNEKRVNELLEDGWVVKMVTPLGAYGYGYGSVAVSVSACGEGNDYRQAEDKCEGADNGFAALLVLTRESEKGLNSAGTSMPPWFRTLSEK